jgi:hypothetical protein
VENNSILSAKIGSFGLEGRLARIVVLEGQQAIPRDLEVDSLGDVTVLCLSLRYNI